MVHWLDRKYWIHEGKDRKCKREKETCSSFWTRSFFIQGVVFSRIPGFEFEARVPFRIKSIIFSFLPPYRHNFVTSSPSSRGKMFWENGKTLEASFSVLLGRGEKRVAYLRDGRRDVKVLSGQTEEINFLLTFQLIYLMSESNQSCLDRWNGSTFVPQCSKTGNKRLAYPRK